MPLWKNRGSKENYEPEIRLVSFTRINFFLLSFVKGIKGRKSKGYCVPWTGYSWGRNAVLYSVHCTVNNVQTVYIVNYTVDTVQCALYNVHYNAHCTLYTVQWTLYTVSCIQYRIFLLSYTRTLYTVNGTVYRCTHISVL